MVSEPPTTADGSHPSSTSITPAQAQRDRGYGVNIPSDSRPAYVTTSSTTTAVTDFGTPSNPIEASPVSQSAALQNYGRFNEEWDASQRGSSIIDGPALHRSISAMSQGDSVIPTPTRGGTLKKKPSLKRGSSLRRSGSRRSSRAGSVRSLALQPDTDEIHSAFFSPVPTTGNPTEILANRFAAWRKVLKDLITYFREIQTQYDHRAKTLLKVSNVINNTSRPAVFLASGGIDDALQILRDYHKQVVMESNKSKAIEEDVILALIGLRSDLQQKIKEIKNLSGDFKNSVDKEMDSTRRAVQNLGDALGQSDIDSAQRTGKQDPYLLRLAVDRQVEKQIDEENYLHQAYLNLETSGRELEAIVVGEIQKAYNAYAGILKREGDEAYNAVENLRTGPIAMPKDHEWNSFVRNDENFIDPKIAVREAQNIYYPGRDHELAAEVRAGLLERKSKYLKSYTAGWYVLSPTHLHEFKSADKTQAPIMSLYLPEQKLGSHSNEGGSSNKFMLKGRQTGTMHRGHSWVFRAESHDTMMAWYEDIKSLTEKSPQERSAFVRQHARSFSGTSQKAGSVSSDGVMDEEDDEPFSGATSSIIVQTPRQDILPKRPQPGGRFPSDLQVDAQRGLQAPLSHSSASSGFADLQNRDIVAAAADLPGSGVGEHYSEQHHQQPYGLSAPGRIVTDEMRPSRASQLNEYAREDGLNPYTYQPVQKHNTSDNSTNTTHIAAIGAAAIGVAGAEAHHDRQAADAPEVVAFATRDDDLYDEKQHANLAAQEASKIAAPDMNEAVLGERLAVQEATMIAAPDIESVGPNLKPPVTSVDNSRGDLAMTEHTASIVSSAAGAHAAAGTASESVNAFQVTSEGKKNMDSVDNTVESEEGVLKRPTLADTVRAGQYHGSVSSVSQLHVPGEYPRVTPTTE